MTDESCVGLSGASHEHAWAEFPSLDGTRRKCSCGQLEEKDEHGWRVVLSGHLRLSVCRPPLHFDRDAVLIVDCPGCVAPDLANKRGRQCDGLREWTARFLSTPDPDHPGFNMLVPENEHDLICPDCGRQGRVYAY